MATKNSEMVPKPKPVEVHVRYLLQRFTVDVTKARSNSFQYEHFQFHQQQQNHGSADTAQFLASTPLSALIELCSQETGVLPQDIRIWKDRSFLNEHHQSLQYYSIEHGSSVVMVASQRNDQPRWQSQDQPQDTRSPSSTPKSQDSTTHNNSRLDAIHDIMMKAHGALTPQLQAHAEAARSYINGDPESKAPTTLDYNRIEAHIGQFIDQLDAVQAGSDEVRGARKSGIKSLQELIKRLQQTHQEVEIVQQALLKVRSVHEHANQELVPFAQSHFIQCKEYVSGVNKDITFEKLEQDFTRIEEGLIQTFIQLDEITFPHPTDPGRELESPVTKLRKSVLQDLQEWYDKVEESFDQAKTLGKANKTLDSQASVASSLIPVFNQFIKAAQQFVDGEIPDPPNPDMFHALCSSFDQIMHTISQVSYPAATAGKEIPSPIEVRKNELLAELQKGLNMLMESNQQIYGITQALGRVVSVHDSAVAKVFPIADTYIADVKAYLEGTVRYQKEGSHPTAEAPTHLTQGFRKVYDLLTQEILKLDEITFPSPSPGHERSGPVSVKRRGVIEVLKVKSAEAEHWNGVVLAIVQRLSAVEQIWDSALQELVPLSDSYLQATSRLFGSTEHSTTNTQALVQQLQQDYVKLDNIVTRAMFQLDEIPSSVEGAPRTPDSPIPHYRKFVIASLQEKLAQVNTAKVSVDALSQALNEIAQINDRVKNAVDVYAAHAQRFIDGTGTMTRAGMLKEYKTVEEIITVGLTKLDGIGVDMGGDHEHHPVRVNRKLAVSYLKDLSAQVSQLKMAVESVKA